MVDGGRRRWWIININHITSRMTSTLDTAYYYCSGQLLAAPSLFGLLTPAPQPTGQSTGQPTDASTVNQG